ncbi:ABC transporter substrate-binding protein [Gordonia paraffinivorans]|uniref:endolytic transglycosylase MltG n=1 Tax=Gordonia paraffinivorans TaxID=175628 RepID=UPI000D6142CC|nr:endolytic transglycosylase MltG [Gordonia paraffinivorans]PWD43097.1 ABC transporter substrate-binding protein [Gordonia paraffinivorans]
MRDGESDDPSTESGGEPAVTDERRRTRHRDQGRRAEGMDPERLRYFTQPAEGTPHTRHRRRRSAQAPGTTGPIPGLTPATPPGQRATPVRIPPGGQIPQQPRTRPVPPAADGQTEARTTPRASRPAEPQPAEPHASRPAERQSPLRRPVPPREDRPVAEGETDTDFIVERRPAPAPDRRVDDPRDADDFRDVEVPEPSSAQPRRLRAARTDTEVRALHDPGEDDGWWPGVDDVEEPAAPRRPRRRSREKQKQRRAVVAVAVVFMLALVGGIGYFGLKTLGVFDSRKDYTNAAGTSDVIVDIPDNSTLADFGRILVDADVVGSVRAFVDAADGRPISGGIYKLRTQIPASTAVEMLTDESATHRVGRVVVPPGLQLDSKTGIDGKVTPGIFQRIQDATTVDVNGRSEGVTVTQLEEAAANSTPEELGVPSWAKEAVESMTGDHRRIEGLIAPATWERVEPQDSPVQILHDMIAKSATMFESWGLLDKNNSGLQPYETLVAASIVEREVRHEEDAPKVARVIRNRLDRDQKLEMDSTQNYTADVTNIDVHGDAYKADTEWNTYRYKGLPPTPIASVGMPALEAMLDPAPGRWLYFVTVDTAGTTRFADTFEEHKRNREEACDNKLVSTGCQ